MKQYKKERGFTIVELLIIIVVIATLAAISVVAYTGIQDRSHDSTVQQDLRQIGQRLEMYRAEYGYYPTSQNTDMAELGLSVSTESYHEEWFTGSASNLWYCHPDNGEGDMALIARSASGTTYQFNGSTSEYNGSTAVDTTAWCRDAGAPISDTTQASRVAIRDASGWASWIRQ